MLQVYDSITQQHDLRLVIVAVFICFLAAYTTFSLIGRAVEAGAKARAWWIGAGAVATGSGVWATHFIALIAYQPNVPVGYALGPTLLSVLIAMVISGLGLAVSMTRAIGMPLLGGAIIGAGAGAMHYVGMSALVVPGIVESDTSTVIASLLIGIVGGGVAALIGLAKFDPTHRLSGAILLTLAICGLHFTGVTGAVVTPDPSAPMPEQTVSPVALAIAVTAVTLMVLCFALAGSILDEHLVSRSAKEAERLAASEARFRQLTDATFEGILMHKGSRIIDTNRAMSELMGVPQEALVGRDVMDCVADSSRPILRKYMGDDIDTACEIELRHADGTLIPAEVLTRTFRSEEGNGTTTHVLAVRDIRERKEAEERIRHMAHHDSLTGLPNRRMFMDRLVQVLARSKRDGTTVAVLCMDLDRFKHVNDLGGHAAGDELLRQVARRLGDSIRTEDTAARLGGDEFAVIQVGVAHPDGPGIMAERLVKSIGKPFDLGGAQTMIGTSIGIALHPGDGEEGEDLVRAADTALYRAKEAGRGTFRFFEAEMDVRLQERRLLERDLRQALAEEQLRVHYQPLADCGGGKIVGFEALVRWTHPVRGPISPVQFIPLAEECGLIMPLGAWVMRRACTDAATWPDDKLVAVNLSPAQFRHADLAKEILAVLKETGLPANRLELEVTESLLIDDPDRVLATLQVLKEAGVRISLDDFGTGYSSLSYLQRFPFDKIKIDRSFVSQMEKNADSMSIIRAVIALGKSLRIKVTAEGVESASQLNLLQQENCDLVQGYLLGKPMAKEDLGKMLSIASATHEAAAS
ncbi:bifunctional diguanylate cyclase/phosphodiesterase [Dongia sedimenti]|uniref:EAL domain-containing protein n=1 Tax=Dongia sedimenti TaxID=3064282 RepID=A0ABU0YQ91_9PROT|nr:EAL domain-containing protein [Rhodospirillaceae bacterium R-7]